MIYNPNIHHRHSIRLKGYDYSRAGLYYITVCTQNRECLFSEIANSEMILNDAGRMVDRWYHELENKYCNIICHEYVIMPNHIHFVIQNDVDVGADLRVCLGCTNIHVMMRRIMRVKGEHMGSPLHHHQ